MTHDTPTHDTAQMAMATRATAVAVYTDPAKRPTFPTRPVTEHRTQNTRDTAVHHTAREEGSNKPANILKRLNVRLAEFRHEVLTGEDGRIAFAGAVDAARQHLDEGVVPRAREEDER